MTDSAGWVPVAHACRTCGGRVFKQATGFWCGGCNARSEGTPSPICGCGIKMAGRQAFHCAANPAPNAQAPHSIVIQRGPAPVMPGGRFATR